MEEQSEGSNPTSASISFSSSLFHTSLSVSDSSTHLNLHCSFHNPIKVLHDAAYSDLHTETLHWSIKQNLYMQ